jgi:hypothetical protein
MYGDHGTGKIWSLTLNGTETPTNTLLNDSNLIISSFGLDGDQEFYIRILWTHKLTEAAIPEFQSLFAFAFLVGAMLLTAMVIKKRGGHFSA